MIKLIVAGGRNFNDYQTVKTEILKEYGHCLDDLEIVSGGAKGADSLGEKFADEFGKKKHMFKADWSNLDAPKAVIKTNKYGAKYNAMAGFIRNGDMADFATDLIAFWDGESSGTKNMIAQAQAKGLNVKIISI